MARQSGGWVAGRPYVLLSAAMSVDGYIDDASSRRLVLSNEADLDRVDEMRAGCDAILVGAGTIRRDDPCLLVRSARRREARLARGQPASPAKVTLSGSGDLDSDARFFTAEAAGGTAKVVYLPPGIAEQARHRLPGAVLVDGAGARCANADGAVLADADGAGGADADAAGRADADGAGRADADGAGGGGPDGALDLAAILADLAARGVARLLVEGGSAVHTQFLTAGLADELQLAVAPLFVGDPAAPRFVRNGVFPHDQAHRMELARIRQIGDVVVISYVLSARA